MDELVETIVQALEDLPFEVPEIGSVAYVAARAAKRLELRKTIHRGHP
jgi:hypothetical protein